ncbi:IQ domain-containing protein E [Camelus dromedarius]|uniref:IQ domain-containing protein E n=1 Tax=Camelus dromedarius TaxID=9838 RepID=A0A5N4CWB1_CAMDR|nr:IQ domain-containing protein E [Camelus dromedarius]
MSLGTGEPASETGDDSLSAITFDSDPEKLSAKAKRRSFHKPPPTSPTEKSGLLESSEDSSEHAPRQQNVLDPPEAVAGKLQARLIIETTPPIVPACTCSVKSVHIQTRKSDPSPEIRPHLGACVDHPPQQHPRLSDRSRKNEEVKSQAFCQPRRPCKRAVCLPAGSVPGTPIHREKEDMYDEIIELKKSLHMQKSDVDLMRTKLRRLEEENSRKDRQIEQLLDPSRGPDFVRTLAEKRPDTGWVINGLKQRIVKLEQQCKEKDSTINKLQTDMKTTNLEEMRIAMETYYEEIHRLQTLLASSETTGKKYDPLFGSHVLPPVEKKIGLKKQKKMSSAFLSLSRSVQELTEENQSLKEDLDRMLSNSPTISKIKGYVEWSKPRLLRRIAELEKVSGGPVTSPSLLRTTL